MRTHITPEPAAAMRHAALLVLALTGTWVALVSVSPDRATFAAASVVPGIPRTPAQLAAQTCGGPAAIAATRAP